MLLSIIILNYNKTDLTIDCVSSLYKHLGTRVNATEIELIIIDNGSVVKSVDKLKSEIRKNGYKNISVIENKKNLGFSKGCNIGSQYAKGEVLLFLNNDTVVNDTGLWEMLKYIESHNNVAILGGKLTNPSGKEQACVGNFYTPFQAVLLLLGLQRFEGISKNPSQITEVDWVKGGCMMIRTEIFKRLGGFDEKIFMYTEDMEICYRARKIGEKVYFYPNVSIVHKDYGSSDRTFAIVNIYENLLYFYKKHRPVHEYIFLRMILRVKATLLIFFGKIINNSYLTQTYEKALKVA